jgi:plasmid stability protein
MAGMKTTLDLPDDLVRAVKLRALREGRKLKEAVAELLRQGLAAPSTPMPRPTILIDAETGLPSIQGAPGAPIATMSTEEIYAAIQKSQEEEDLERLGVALRR